STSLFRSITRTHALRYTPGAPAPYSIGCGSPWKNRMVRRSFAKAAGLGVGALLLPVHGRLIAAEALTDKLDIAVKRALADAALAAAKAAGATYCDVRIGRYLNQFVVTREDKVQNVVNTESTGVGIRVLANGTWGF